MHRLPIAALALLLTAASAQAARIRYHYAPAGGQGCLQLVPGPGGAPGERLSWIGLTPSPYQTPPPRPTGYVTVLHPDSKIYVQVPITLPAGNVPRIQHWGTTLVYDFGSEAIEIHFVHDGSVDVIYNNGLLRNP